MSDAIAAFFSAWQLESSDERRGVLSDAVTPDVRYDDPRTLETVSGRDALNDYVGQFSASAPGWSARVLKRDTIAGITRVTVAFEGKGPDGNDMTQLGQYVVEMDGSLIRRLVGFVGTGAPG